MKWTLLVTAALVCAGALPASAQDAEPLRVLVREAPPFVIDDGGGSYYGLSVELWQAAAADLGLEYRLEPAGLEQMLEEVADGRAAVGVGATTVTAEREQRLDFTQPFLATGLAIATRSASGDWTAAVAGLFSVQFVRAAGALALLLLVVGALVWVFEHRANAEHFETDPARGLWSGFWFAAVSMTTVGYGDKAPRSIPGRIITLVWMFASIIVISFFTAAIATALTVETLASGIDGPEDLARVEVGVLADTTSERWLARHDIAARTYEDPRAGLRAVAGGEIEAFVHDEPILRWLLRESGEDRVIVLPRVIERQNYAFVLPTGSPLREQLNRALLAYMAGDRYRRLVEQYLGE